MDESPPTPATRRALEPLGFRDTVDRAGFRMLRIGSPLEAERLADVVDIVRPGASAWALGLLTEAGFTSSPRTPRTRPCASARGPRPCPAGYSDQRIAPALPRSACRSRTPQRVATRRSGGVSGSARSPTSNPGGERPRGRRGQRGRRPRRLQRRRSRRFDQCVTARQLHVSPQPAFWILRSCVSPGSPSHRLDPRPHRGPGARLVVLRREGRDAGSAPCVSPRSRSPSAARPRPLS